MVLIFEQIHPKSGLSHPEYELSLFTLWQIMYLGERTQRTQHVKLIENGHTVFNHSK